MSALNELLASLLIKESQLNALEEQQRTKSEQASAIVRLDAQGRIFEVSRDDLLRSNDSFFSIKLSSKHWKVGAHDAYFLDVSSAGFEQVLKQVVDPDAPLALAELSDFDKERVCGVQQLLHLPCIKLQWGHVNSYMNASDTLIGHTEQVRTVCISSDSKLIISGSDDYSVRVWDAATFACLAVLSGHNDSVVSVYISADCTTIVAGSKDYTERVWDRVPATCIAILRGHTNHIRGVSLSADKTQVYSCSFDKAVRCWDVASASCIAKFKDHKELVVALAVVSDGTFVASGSLDSTIRVWNIATGKCS